MGVYMEMHMLEEYVEQPALDELKKLLDADDEDFDRAGGEMGFECDEFRDHDDLEAILEKYKIPSTISYGSDYDYQAYEYYCDDLGKSRKVYEDQTGSAYYDLHQLRHNFTQLLAISDAEHQRDMMIGYMESVLKETEMPTTKDFFSKFENRSRRMVELNHQEAVSFALNEFDAGVINQDELTHKISVANSIRDKRIKEMNA